MCARVHLEMNIHNFSLLSTTNIVIYVVPVIKNVMFGYGLSS